MSENLATSAEVAAYLGVTKQTLANWAYQGRGPSFVKVGRNRRYDWNDLRAWIEARKVQHG